MQRGFPVLRAAVTLITLSGLMMAGLTLKATAPAAQSARQAQAISRLTLGVNVHPLRPGMTRRQIVWELDTARRLGARMIRADLGWATLQEDSAAEFSPWYLAQVDTLVQAANARRIKLLITVSDSPCWASAAPADLRQGCQGAWWTRGVQHYPPRDPRTYAHALAFLVRRYGDSVAAWEVWNEPNLRFYYAAAHPARSYVRLERAAYGAAKRVDPHAFIVAGATSGADPHFVDQLFSAGLGNRFDALSIHPYTDGAPPTSPGTPRWIANSFVRGIPAVRRTEVASGHRQPIWVTEMGWSTCSARHRTESWLNCVSDRRQALYLKAAIGLAKSWRYVRALLVYELSDEGRHGSVAANEYGLLLADGSPKPAATVLRTQ
jgi:polysaccharide biosynthesis protein PslG